VTAIRPVNNRATLGSAATDGGARRRRRRSRGEIQSPHGGLHGI